MSRYLRVKRDWFAYNPMRINVGSIGWAQSEGQTGVISPDYIVFSCSDRIHPRLLFSFLKHARGLKEINDATAGSVRERLYFDRLAQIEFALPPLVEQQRIVSRVEQLLARIGEARTLRRQTVEEAESLIVAMAHRADLDSSAKTREGWNCRALSDVIHFVDDSHQVIPNRSYPNLGIYSFGRGLFHKSPIDGFATSATSLRRVRAGQFIYSRLFAFEGAYGMVTNEFDGAFVSAEYPTFDCDPTQIRAEFLAAYFRAAHVWKAVAAGSKGLGNRRQRVQPEQVLAHQVWLPPMAWQDRLAEVQREVDALRQLQIETTAELDALLPAILDKAFKGQLL